MTIITPSTSSSSPSSLNRSPVLSSRTVIRNGSAGPRRSSSSTNLMTNKSSAVSSSSSSTRRRSSDNASPSTIGGTMKKAASRTRMNGARVTAVLSKKSEKRATSVAGFEAWAAARVTPNTSTSSTPSSSAGVVSLSSSATFMPSVVAPVWQPSANILALVHQAEVSPRLTPDTITTPIDASSSSSSRLSCPPGFEHVIEPLSTPPTPPCSPVAAVATVPMVPVVSSCMSSPVAVMVHDDFEIATTRVACVVPSMMTVLPQQMDYVTCDPSSPPIVQFASYMTTNAAIRTLIMVLVALAALAAVLFTSSTNQMGFGAALPSVMLFAAFINRSSSLSSSSASLFDDEVTNDMHHNTNGDQSNNSRATIASPSSPPSPSSLSLSLSPKAVGRRSSRRHRIAAH